MSLPTEIIYTELKTKNLTYREYQMLLMVWSVYWQSLQCQGKPYLNGTRWCDCQPPPPLTPQSSQWGEVSPEGARPVVRMLRGDGRKDSLLHGTQARLAFLLTYNAYLFLALWTATSSAWTALSYLWFFYLKNSYLFFKIKVKLTPLQSFSWTA